VRIRSLILLLLLSTTSSLFAQVHGAVGVVLAPQYFGKNGGSWRPVAGADALVQFHRFGIHLNGEIANPPAAGTISALHTNLTYQVPIAHSDFVVLFGAGTTSIRTERSGTKRTTNMELDFGRRFRHVDVYAGLRQFEYEFDLFRGECYMCKRGLNFEAGVRYRIE
jgi:hypothetical protein